MNVGSAAGRHDVLIDPFLPDLGRTAAEREAAIDAAATARGGWTSRQLAQWNVSWPPRAGWKRDLVWGRDPSLAARAPTEKRSQPEKEAA